jgi:hypothetical protein
MMTLLGIRVEPIVYVYLLSIDIYSWAIILFTLFIFNSCNLIYCIYITCWIAYAYMIIYLSFYTPYYEPQKLLTWACPFYD